MTKQIGKKITIVRTHPRRVPVSSKNPTGITIVDRHPRRVRGPANDDLDYKDGSKYDALIAIWVDYFNRKLGVTPPSTPLDPDVIKALIASESEFKKNPRNPKAFGITQITPDTLKALLDPDGETKEFTFKDIRQKDLNDPEIAIPLGVRWIFRKKRLVEGKLGRSPTPDEIILEYKGLLKSKSDYQRQALDNFRKNYARLKKK